jgi:hypothetical protein
VRVLHVLLELIKMLDDFCLLVWSERRVFGLDSRPAEDLVLALKLGPQVRRFEVLLNVGGPLLDPLLDV